MAPRRLRGAAGLLAMALMLAPASTMATAASSYTPGAPGDANCSGQVTGADALAVLRVLAGLQADDPACEGDTDADGLDIDDARVIRRWVAGLPVPPVLHDVLPGSVPVGSPDTTFTLTGGFIVPNTAVAWNGTPYAVTVSDGGSRASVVIPAGEFVTEGPGTVQLHTPGQALSSATAFMVTEPGSCSMPVANSGTLIVEKKKETATFTLNAPQDMTGWTLLSERGPQIFTFPEGYIYNPALGPVTIVSGKPQDGEDTQTMLWWQAAPVWNNTNPDSGSIRDCDGNIIAAWADPPTPGD